MTGARVSETDWVASVPGVVHRLDGQRLLFHPAGGGAGQVVTADVLRAMDACRAFRPIEAQVARVESAVPRMRGHAPAIRQTLAQLLERGLLVAADTIGARLRSASGTGAFGEQPPLVIRTCDRPALLARLLDSGLDYERRTGRRLRWWVLDDSRSSAGRQRAHAAVEAAAGKGLQARWLGHDWQQETVAAVAAGAEAPVEILEWLLLGRGAGPMTTGRTINLALLLTAGGGLCVLDDDFRLDATWPPGVTRAPRFGNHVPWDVHFFDHADAAADFGDARIDDPLAAHLESCGQALGAVLGGPHVDAWTPASMQGCEVSDWRLDGDSRVIATVCGTRGSPASQTTHWLHHLDDETGSFSRFVGAPESYAARAEGRWMAQTRHQPAVLASCLTMPLTLDNRALLPCTMPAGRGEDRVLTAAMAAMYPQHVMLDYPDAWLHQREAGRVHGTAGREALQLSLCDLVVQYCLPLRERAHGAPQRRLAALALAMEELATAPEAVRFDLFREALSKRRSAMVTELEARIAAFQGPADHPWLADARQLQEANQAALTDGEIGHFRDRDDIGTRAALTATIAEQCGRYARALEVWPRLWAYCRENSGGE